jgi:hypothetical protein
MMDQFAWARDTQTAALPRHDDKKNVARWPASIIALRKMAADQLSEQRFIRAYLGLFVVSPRDDGSKIASLARFGAYEVRLVEFAEETCDAPLLWLELYRHDTLVGLDSFRCDNFNDAVMVADAFMVRAKALHEQASPSPREKVAHDILQRLRDAGFACNLVASDEE